jgi:hypothetical protein
MPSCCSHSIGLDTLIYFSHLFTTVLGSSAALYYREVRNVSRFSGQDGVTSQVSPSWGGMEAVVKRNARLSQLWVCSILSSAIWHNIECYIYTNVSEYGCSTFLRHVAKFLPDHNELIQKFNIIQPYFCPTRNSNFGRTVRRHLITLLFQLTALTCGLQDVKLLWEPCCNSKVWFIQDVSLLACLITEALSLKKSASPGTR